MLIRWEAEKSSLVDQPLRGSEGVRALPQKKITFLEALKHSPYKMWPLREAAKKVFFWWPGH